MLENNIEINKSPILKQKLKTIADKNDENDNIRLHRAISWLKCAEEHSDNIDLKFITLWISFNACYADNDNHNISLTEKTRFKEFLKGVWLNLMKITTSSNSFGLNFQVQCACLLIINMRLSHFGMLTGVQR